MELDMSAHYKVAGVNGVSWYLIGYVETANEDTDWTGIMDVDTETVRAIMVGDNRVHEIGVDELEVIPEDSFCRECGQIGCGCNVYA